MKEREKENKRVRKNERKGERFNGQLIECLI